MNNHKLRFDEQFVIEALADTLGGNWYTGENPPDAYLEIDGQTIAVEISTLTQSTFNGTEFGNERRTDDESALRICDELGFFLPKGV
jgi:hypothetical protein